MHIWVDADSCPRVMRSIILKGALRTQLPVTFVADRPLQDIRQGNGVSFQQVPSAENSADIWIISHLKGGDLLITRDIPCAAEAIDKGATAIDDRGQVYTQENIRERLSLRDFYTALREEGSFAEKHKPLGKKEIQQFAAAFDRLLQKALR